MDSIAEQQEDPLKRLLSQLDYIQRWALRRRQQQPTYEGGIPVKQLVDYYELVRGLMYRVRAKKLDVGFYYDCWLPLFSSWGNQLPASDAQELRFQIYRALQAEVDRVVRLGKSSSLNTELHRLDLITSCFSQALAIGAIVMREADWRKAEEKVVPLLAYCKQHQRD